ncbi:MAG: tetratricopeptide repeat protein, partial [Thermoanaerobaculia bacterium]
MNEPQDPSRNRQPPPDATPEWVAATADRAAEDRAPPPSKIRRALPWLAASAVVVTLAVTVATRWLGPEPPFAELDLGGRPVAARLIVLPFANATGNPANDWVSTGLAEMVAATLERTPGVSIASSERLQGVIAARGLDPGDPIGRDRIRELALALGAELTLEARFRHGSNRPNAADAVAADFQIFDADGQQAEGTVKGTDFLEAGDRLAFSVARGLVSGHVPVRLSAAYSRDPFADRLYAMGLHQLRTAGADVAAPYFEIALRSRPAFLQAKVRLAECAELDSDLTRAGDLAREVLEQARGRGEQHFQAWSLRALGRLAIREGRLENAQENYSQAFSIVLGADDAGTRADLMFELARLALIRGATGRAEELFIETLQIRQDQNDRLGEVDALLEIASLF